MFDRLFYVRRQVVVMWPCTLHNNLHSEVSVIFSSSSWFSFFFSVTTSHEIINALQIYYLCITCVCPHI